MKIITLMVLLTALYYRSSAQNNPIFNGGNSDGWDSTAYQQASNNIFTGGIADGWSKTGFQQSVNNIFTGGDGDGWDKTSFAQPLNNIFRGGEDDGWDKTSFAQPLNNIFTGGSGDGWDSAFYVQPGNAIYNGGSGDGWDKTNFIQAGNNIFFGGIGDGWSSTYRPQGTLPVTFEYFTATKLDETAALLKWKTSMELNTVAFDVERSADALSFVKIGQVAAVGTSNTAIEYSFTDHMPLRGMNYYRIKESDVDGHMIYTPARVVKFDTDNEGSIKYYPNPTNAVVTIELTTGMLRQPLVINVSTVSGIVTDQVKIQRPVSNIIRIDLSRYAKGVYFIQVKSGNTNNTQRIVLQ